MDLAALHRPGLRISAAPLDLDAYRRDLWPRATLEMRDGKLPPAPAVVTWPRDDEEVAAILDWAGREGAAVVPYGAGSGVCGAAAGRAGSVVIDTKRMDHIRDLDPERRTVRLGPGLLGLPMEERLARLGWQTGHSPSSLWCSTVGGYVAARSAGQYSSRYGVFDDMLLAATAVTPSGLLRGGMWCPPDEEDLLPLLAGSEGALGVITDTLVRVVPIPEERSLRGYAFPSLNAAWDAMRALMQAGLWPFAMRLYDPLDTRIGGRTGKKKAHKESAKRGATVLDRLKNVVMSAPGLRRHLLDLPLSLPGLVNRLASGLGNEVLLIVGFEGTKAENARHWRAAEPLLAAGRALGPEPGELWFAHRHNVSYKLAPIFMAGAFADTMEVAAPWSRLGELYAGVREALGRHALVMAHFSHAYPEGCSIYFSFAGSGDTGIYDALWTDALAAARACGGTVTHHHGVGPLKAREAAREAGAAVRVWREIKARLDPDNRMNPGRLFPSDEPELPGPAAPTGGPVFSVDEQSQLAEVDPAAPIAAVEAALAAVGLALRVRADRPLGAWLTALRRGALEAWEVPVFAVQARFSDGVSVRLGGPPRSAAGPDLRLALLRRAVPELVTVPVRARLGIAVAAPGPECDARDVRPAWVSKKQWGFAGPAAAVLAEGPGTRSVAPDPPTRRPSTSP